MMRKKPLVLAGLTVAVLGLSLQGTALAAGSGATWQVAPSPNPGLFPTLQAVAASSATDAWTVGHYSDPTNSTFFSLAEHWNGSAWSVVSTPNPFGNENVLNAVADLSPANAWAVGYSVDDSNYLDPVYQPLIEHWNGTAWATAAAATDASGGTDQLSGVAAVSATDVWAVGSHFDAAIGGFDQLIEHWNGSSWTIVPSPASANADLTAVTAISATDVWAAGETGAGQPIFEHWNGKAWTAVSGPSISSQYLSIGGLAAASTNDVWAVGYTRAPVRRAPYTTLAEHWDGTKWSVVPSPDPAASSNLFLGVAAVSSTDVWAVGYQYTATGGAAPILANWNGTSWTTVATPVPAGTTYNELAGVAAVPTGSVFTIGRADYEELNLQTSNG
jgi:hypothetical protein